MSVETLGEAWTLSWKIHIRCLDDGREGMKHKRACGFRQELDMMTLVCTRGRDFPLARIAERLRCPAVWLPGHFGDVHHSAEQPDQFAVCTLVPRPALSE